MLAGNTFPRAVRLLTSAEFREVIQTARKMHLERFSILVKKNDLGHARLGVTISRRNAKHAVVRNRVKRTLREGFRLHRAKLGGYDLLFVAKPRIAECGTDALFHTLEPMWQKLITQFPV